MKIPVRQSLTDQTEIRILHALGHPLTHKEISTLLGITRSGVHEAEKRALRKIRRVCAEADIDLSWFMPEAVAAAENGQGGGAT